jgi:hypothetical protein
MIKIKYKESKAGSPPEEKNDCTVRALAIATNSTYTKAYMLLCQAGRKHNKGFYIERLLKKHCSYLGHSFFKLPFRKPITVSKFIQKYPKGTYYVKIRGHVFVIRESVVYDMVEPRPMQRITDAWEVTDNKKEGQRLSAAALV